MAKVCAFAQQTRIPHARRLRFQPTAIRLRFYPVQWPTGRVALLKGYIYTPAHWGERVPDAKRRAGEVGMRRRFPHLTPALSAPRSGEGAPT
jgi:hypothetical protein